MSLFYPDVMLENIYEIDSEKLKKNGIKAVVFDIDNTLAYNAEPSPSEKAITFLNNLKKDGFYVIVASNNTEERVKKFCQNLDSLYVHKANKPLGRKIRALLKEIDVDKKEAAIVGDQIFTDILCGKMMNMFAILVKPFDTNENKFIKFKRKVENLFIKWD